MAKKFWAVSADYDLIQMDHAVPKLLGPFGTELERDNAVAEGADEWRVVSWFKFSLPEGVSPEDRSADVGFDEGEEDLDDEDEGLDD